MKILKAIAIDDEPLALRVIESHCQKVPFCNLVYSTTKVLEALSYLQSNKVDLIFLDVQMPELTGLQFIDVMGGQIKVILTTAYEQYALSSYEYDVVDYLLKPISFERLLKAVQKALNQTLIATSNNLPANLPETSAENENPIDCIFIKTEYKLQKIFYDDILYLEGGKDYVTIYTKHEKFLSLAGLTKIQQNLPYPRFMRVHKSYVVALNKIDSIERQRIFLGNEVIAIGDMYKEEFAKNVKGV
ncbi:LytR/AlgR family response regulator transcription factor [Mucilaginibacter sp. E4BP6]|jgi:two-component system LytT family response regulator|uniref:LytR/AlgR family response regulator transcription factor n=1 Tax=Mucilaginibacter sp. E4BP6 TaxID=2723089 RepID=UPI0015CB1EC6|nr:LytTR family DNA-binding domain-containing protein [Mucilaginibacter sp. E4BP6]NYE68407.1 DNA-binding LytR/AlgR family response regulator [Mucilaginibacter sp. E4BP6]